MELIFLKKILYHLKFDDSLYRPSQILGTFRYVLDNIVI